MSAAYIQMYFRNLNLLPHRGTFRRLLEYQVVENIMENGAKFSNFSKVSKT